MGDREQAEGEGIRAEEEPPAVYRDEGGSLLPLVETLDWGALDSIGRQSEELYSELVGTNIAQE